MFVTYADIHNIISIFLLQDIHFPVFISKCDHASCRSDELSFKKGDVMYIIDMEEEGRWFAQLKKTGKQGYIPNASVEVFRPLHTEK